MLWYESMDEKPLNDWFDWVESWVPRLGKIAGKLPEELQPIFFEVALRHIIGSPITPGLPQPLTPTTPTAVPSPTVNPIQPDTPRPERWSTFAKEFSVSISDVERLVSASTGEVLVRNLGKTGSQIQRKVAALLAVWKCSQGQEMVVSTD